MLPFKHDKIIRDRLQTMDEMPAGVHFDAAAAWQKVEIELQSQRKQKAPLWMAVAAVLLLAVLSTVIFSGKKEKGFSTKVSPAVVPYTLPMSAMQHTREAIATTASPVIISKKKVHTNPTTEPVDTTANEILVAEESPEVLTTTRTEIIVPAPVVTAPATPLTVKKKRWKVIHLDELYQPAPEDIVKAETRKKSEEPVAETEPAKIPSSRSFWKSKTPPKIPITITDNQ